MGAQWVLHRCRGSCAREARTWSKSGLLAAHQQGPSNTSMSESAAHVADATDRDPPSKRHCRFRAGDALEQRLPGRGALDVFIVAAARDPNRTALTMLMTGE
jgi:hypothetical protein